ncbi:efflux RND transporter periplasmic adaptor subunit [Microlunatus parietis]|uniref:HlyD family secretion protein n=1 Tax=Microlunatus parietis TaxID=682979 RepID=A0A7Y9LB69_9ACTN|nr:HlyD family efflux transporter periplasmic adaptor subunit [Microlunatus parietis]NYE69511.1 HlyD family secretion protein [Microlunatus parietis]
MGRAARGVATATLAVIGVAAAGLGLVLGRPAAPTAGSSHLTESVGKGVVRKTVSDTGVIADRYTYSIRPEADPVLLAVHGQETEQSGSQGSTSGSTETATYTLDELKVGPGERVEKGDLLAVVRDADDEKVDVDAPFDGVVRSVSSAKQAVLTEVATLGVGRSEVVVEVSQYDVIRLAEDKNVELSLDTDRTGFDGTIAEIAQSATSNGSSDGAGSDAAVQTYQVIIRVSRLPKSARIGMSVSSKITISSRDQALSVPLTAVADQNGDSTVRLLRADGTIEVRPVTVGLVGDTRVEITKGLRTGDDVIIGDAGQGAPQPAPQFGGGPFDDDSAGGGTAAGETGR